MLPILPERTEFPNDVLAALLETLDTGAAVDSTAIHRWQLAAEDGQWTPEEAMDAARWLNLHHTGYVKIAHLHERIETERKWLKTARVVCFRSDAAIWVMSQTMKYRAVTPEQAVRVYEEDPQAWRAAFEQAVWDLWTRRQWLAWIFENAARLQAGQ